MSAWLYNNLPLEDSSIDITQYTGFIYRITNTTTGRIYIGKKSLFTHTKHKLTKKQLAEHATKKGRKPTHEIVTKESKWQSYWGSCDELQSDIKALGEECFTKEILHWCANAIDLTYWEVHYQCIHEVLLQDSYNSNILGKFYKGRVSR